MKKWQKQDYFPSEVGEGGVAHFLLSPWALSDWDLQMFDYAKASYKGGLHCSVSWKLQPGSWGQTREQSSRSAALLLTTGLIAGSLPGPAGNWGVRKEVRQSPYLSEAPV